MSEQEPSQKPEPTLKSAGKKIFHIISSIMVILFLVVISMVGICAIYSAHH